MKSKLGYYLTWAFWLCILGAILFGLSGWMWNLLIFHAPAEIFILLAIGSWGVLIILDLVNKHRKKGS